MEPPTAEQIDRDLQARRRAAGIIVAPSRVEFSHEALAAKFPRTFGGLGGDPPSTEALAAADRRREAHDEHMKARRNHANADGFLADRGERYQTCRLANFETATSAQREALARLREYLDDLPKEIAAGNGIVLFGPSGTGKDHLMIGAAYAAIFHHGYAVQWRNGVELYGAMREAIDNDEDEARVLRPLRFADILVLSDPLPPGGELTRYQKETLYRVLESRYSSRRPTWVTLNVRSGSEAGERLGVACYDRLRDGALCVYCNWPSYRKPRG